MSDFASVAAPSAVTPTDQCSVDWMRCASRVERDRRIQLHDAEPCREVEGDPAHFIEYLRAPGLAKYSVAHDDTESSTPALVSPLR